MKKIIASMAVALMIALVPLSLVGCSSKDPRSGTWKFTGKFEYVNISTAYAATHEEFNEAEYQNMPTFKLYDDGSRGEMISQINEDTQVITNVRWSGGETSLMGLDVVPVPESTLTKNKDMYNITRIYYKEESEDVTLDLPYSPKNKTLYFYITSGTYESNGSEIQYAIYAIYKK